MAIDLEKFERLGQQAIDEAIKNDKIFREKLIPFAVKIGLHKESKSIEEAGNKAILWAKEKAKYCLEFNRAYFYLPPLEEYKEE